VPEIEGAATGETAGMSLELGVVVVVVGVAGVVVFVGVAAGVVLLVGVAAGVVAAGVGWELVTVATVVLADELGAVADTWVVEVLGLAGLRFCAREAATAISLCWLRRAARREWECLCSTRPVWPRL
jgi:hypothetical protein